MTQEAGGAMTFNEFVRKSKRLQRQYIAEEKRRIAKLMRAWQRYAVAAQALNLHPLTLIEIRDRERELDRMTSEVDAKYRDTTEMRIAYDFHLQRDAERGGTP
jgi:tRNA 2-selenouridine synthase SelU